jgi:hypothetical protein
VKDGRKVFADDGSAGFEVGQLSREECALHDLPRSVLPIYERAIMAAAKLQAESPHRSTLPPKGQFESRVRTDDGGRKERVWFGRESFIKGLGRPGRKVAAILSKGEPIWPFISRALVR